MNRQLEIIATIRALLRDADDAVAAISEARRTEDIVAILRRRRRLVENLLAELERRVESMR
jgi:hypothetical protein